MSRLAVFVSRRARRVLIVSALSFVVAAALGSPDVVGPEIGEQVSADLARAALIALSEAA